MITNRVPNTWQDLEEAVAEILNKSGLSAERGRLIDTVRGQVRVDVHATQPVGRRVFTLLCECKHWQAAVPQAVVDGFRTVMADSGADRGYIISSAGYQRGAHEHARLTNIRLVTWEQFQAEFVEDYFENYVRRRLQECVDSLVSFTEPISPATFLASGRLSEDKLPEFLELKTRYADMALLCLPFFPGLSGYLAGTKRLMMPLSSYNVKGLDVKIPEHLLDIDNYEEFLEVLCVEAESAVESFSTLLTLPG
jgi:restriction system protein